MHCTREHPTAAPPELASAAVLRQAIFCGASEAPAANAGAALTHKSASGTYQAFAIDIGCYAHMRKLQGKFNEIDVSTSTAKEKMRSAPILTSDFFAGLWGSAPEDPEGELLKEDVSEG